MVGFVLFSATSVANVWRIAHHPYPALQQAFTQVDVSTALNAFSAGTMI
jgi:hypothetical protein